MRKVGGGPITPSLLLPIGQTHYCFSIWLYVIYLPCLQRIHKLPCLFSPAFFVSPANHLCLCPGLLPPPLCRCLPRAMLLVWLSCNKQVRVLLGVSSLPVHETFPHVCLAERERDRERGRWRELVLFNIHHWCNLHLRTRLALLCCRLMINRPTFCTVSV